MTKKCKGCQLIQIYGPIACERCPAGDNKK